MTKPNQGQKTSFSRELKPSKGVDISSNVDDFDAAVPSSITLVEKAGKLNEDGLQRCDIYLTWAHVPKRLYANAEQLLSLCLDHSKELAKAFYNGKTVACGIAIGVIKGRFVVEPAA